MGRRRRAKSGWREGRTKRPKARAGTQWSPLRIGLAVLVFVAAVGLGVALSAGHHATPKTSIAFVEPRQGEIVTSPVQVEISLQGAVLGVPSSGHDHLHLSVDGGLPLALYGSPDVTLPLPPGPHILYVQLAGPDHAPLGPQAQVRFSVR